MSEGFATLARQFCAWAERGPGAPAEELRTGLALLPLLYEGALCLPRGWPDYLAEGLERPPDVAQDGTRRRFSGGVTGEAADDLARVYADMKTGLWLLERRHPDLAAAQWGESFWTQWGRHCLAALQALHAQASRVEPD